jgi:hypothetical protein
MASLDLESMLTTEEEGTVCLEGADSEMAPTEAAETGFALAADFQKIKLPVLA